MPVKTPNPARQAGKGHNRKGIYIMSYPSPRRNNPNHIPIYVNGRVIGVVAGATFKKTITGSKHLLRRPRAIAFERCTLRDAAASGATCAAILDRETGTTYTISFETIDRHSFPVLRGHGDQVAVTLEHWAINGATPVAVASVAQTNQQRKELQLSLFGEVGR
jgi:hypothetical protein